MTSEQFEELKAIQDAYLEMANKRQEEVVEEQLEEAVDNRFSRAEKEKEIAADHKGEEEPAYRSKSPKRSGFSALDRWKAKQGIKEEEVFESERSEKYKTIVSSLDRMRAKATANAELQKLQKQNKDHKKLPEDVEEEIEELDEKSDQAKQNKTQKNTMDASRGAKWKLDNNATGDAVRNWDGKHPSRQSQNKAIGRALRQEEVESLEEEKIPVNHAHDAVGSVLGQSAAVKFATNLKAGTAKHTTWKDINKTLVKQGEQTHHIAKIAAKLKPAQYNEEIEELDEISDKLATNYTAKSQKAYNDPKTTPEKKANRRKGLITAYLKSKAEANVPTTYESVEELDEVSMATLDSYRKKAFAEPGENRQAGRALAYDKSGSHGDSKVKSSEEIANAKSQIKTLIKPEHHSKYPIHKITSHTSARKIYKDASAAGHLIEEVELDEMNIGKKQPRPDTHHIVDKENKPLSLAAYYDKAKAEKDRDEKHPGAKVITRGPRGKVKEEVELDEKELTDTDVKQKEKVVKGMKKNIQSFKDKYGERAKGVMYATATKIAQKMPDVKEEVELEEAKKEPMEVYHTGYSAALQHAEKHLNKQGYEIHPDDWQQHISHGPSKPSEGKTVQLHVPLHKDGVKSKKVAHIQVYNRGNTIPKNNELNMYVN